MKKTNFFLMLMFMLVSVVLIGCTKTTTSKTTTSKKTTVSITSKAPTTKEPTTKPSTATVPTTQIKGNAVFEGVSDVSISVGTEFSKTTGVTAKDYDGTDLTSEISTSGLFNANRAGSYKITYKVTGKNGVEVIATRTITVSENAFITTTKSSITLVIGAEFNPLEGVTATDGDVDGTDITDKVTYSYSEGFVLTEAGVGEVIYKVVGSNGQEIMVSIPITIVAPEKAKIFFGTVEAPTDGSGTITRTFDFNPLAGLKAFDYDGEDLSNHVVVEGQVNNFVVGSYTLVYKVTGKNNEEARLERTIEVVDRYIEIAGNRYAVDQANINPEKLMTNQQGPSSGVITILTGMPEGTTGFASGSTQTYPVVIVCDAQGRIVYARDPFMGEFQIKEVVDPETLEVSYVGEPIRTFKIGATPEETLANFNKDVSAGGGTGFGQTTIFKDIANFIPEGGFIIVCPYSQNADSNYGENHPVRKFGLDMGRRIGALVRIVGLEIPGYTQKDLNELILFEGVEDEYLLTGTEFDAMANVKAFRGEDEATVVAVKSTVDVTTPGKYYVIYKATIGNEYVYYTRRVVVEDTLTDARIEGTDQKIFLNKVTDLRSLVKAFEFTRELINYKLEIEDGGFDFTKEGEYVVTYKVTGQSGVQVTKTIMLTVSSEPTINLRNEEVTIDQGQAFDAAFGTSAIDYNGNIITVTVSEYDVNQIGEQTIIITAVGALKTATKEIKLTVLGPKPVLEFTDSANVVINTEFDALKFVVLSKDHNGIELTPTWVIEKLNGEVWELVENIDTTVLGSYRVTYKLVGEYQEVVSTLNVEVIDPNPSIVGVKSQAVIKGTEFTALTGVKAFDAFGVELAAEKLLVKIKLISEVEGVETLTEVSAIDVNNIGTYVVTYTAVDGEYQVQKVARISIIEEPTHSMFYVDGVAMLDRYNVYENITNDVLEETMTNAVNASLEKYGEAGVSTTILQELGYSIFVYDNMEDVPTTINYIGGASAGVQIFSMMFIIDAQGNVRFARSYSKPTINGKANNSVDQIERGVKEEFSTPTVYNANTCEFGALMNNIIVNGTKVLTKAGAEQGIVASAWTLQEGEKLVVIGGHGGTAGWAANWFRTLSTDPLAQSVFSLNSNVQYFEVEANSAE